LTIASSLTTLRVYNARYGDEVKRLKGRAFWLLLIVAWLGIGIFMTVIEEYFFAGISYVIAAFYVFLELWLWRRSKRLQKAAGQPDRQDTPVGQA
jgi:hypothetical protein